jgi:hypothetical protein
MIATASRLAFDHHRYLAQMDRSVRMFRVAPTFDYHGHSSTVGSGAVDGLCRDGHGLQ